MTSKPMVFVVADSMKGGLCDSCLAAKPSLTACKVCQQMFYCNKICQQNDWSLHRLECHTFANTPRMPSATKIMIRLWFMTQNDQSLEFKTYSLPNGQYLSLNELKVNGYLDEDIVKLLEDSDKYSVNLNEDIPIKDMAIIQFKALVEVFNESLLNVDLAQLWNLFIRVWSNVLKIDVFESDNTDNAYGLFVELSSLEHSCEPNACYVSYGSRLQVRAIQPIKPNDKITISYVDIANPKDVRQDHLKSYFLECFCKRCRTDDEVSDEDYREFQRLNALLNEEISRSEYINGDKLIAISEQLVPYYEAIYPDFYPDLSLFLMKYLRVMLKNVVKTKAKVNREFLDYVVKSVRITHGVDHKIYRKVTLIGGITLSDLSSDADHVLKSLRRKSSHSYGLFVSAVFVPSLLFIFYYLHLFLKQIKY